MKSILFRDSSNACIVLKLVAFAGRQFHTRATLRLTKLLRALILPWISSTQNAWQCVPNLVDVPCLHLISNVPGSTSKRPKTIL